jgi:hypothetical protein
MKISIKSALAFLTFVGTLALALPVTAQEVNTAVILINEYNYSPTSTDPVTATVAAAPAANSSTCPDFGYAKIGEDNNADQVHNLQTFLRESEHLDVGVNGTFDVKTEQAVEAFQKKYMSDVMGPWDATRASGIVNLTTVKKVRQLLCGEPLSLNARELMAIADYQSGSIARLPASTSRDTASLTLEPLGTLQANQIDNAAAVGTAGGASLLHRFLSFVKHIFAR